MASDMSAGAPLYMPALIDTNDLSDRDRMPLLRDYFAREFLGVDIVPAGEIAFRLRARALNLPGVQVGLAHATTLTATRHRYMLADGLDDIGLSVFLEDAHISVDGRHDADIRGGDGIFYALSRPWAFRQKLSAVTGILFKRHLLGPLLPHFDDKPFHIVPQAAGRLRLLTGYAETLVDGALGLDGPGGLLVARQLAELAALALNFDKADSRPKTARTGIAAARLALFKRDVEKFAADPEFGVVMLAARHSVTPRYVQLLFDAAGTTFTATLRDCRLQRAYRLLSDPASAGRSIGLIAFDAGFSDLSHFNRAFRHRFGATPSEIRSQHLQHP